MKNEVIKIIGAALLAGAVYLPLQPSWAGSCCGGGVATGLILPKYADGMIDVSFDRERYNGFWNQQGRYIPDPAQSDLQQYRLNLGYAQRVAANWQAGVLIPYVWNDNVYSGLSSRSDGLGDTSLNLWYEATEDTSAWKIRGISDLKPSILIGPSLLVPTGISPYDNVNSSFDVTGRGFYRIDGNVFINKTFHPWDVSLALSYGAYVERSINREYGKYIEPYHKKLGDRGSALFSLGYIYYLGTSGDTLTGNASFIYLREADGTIEGRRFPDSGFRKEALAASIAYSSTDHDWSVRASWSHAVREDGWGENFPTTDIYSLGVRYVFR